MIEIDADWYSNCSNEAFRLQLVERSLSCLAEAHIIIMVLTDLDLPVEDCCNTLLMNSNRNYYYWWRTREMSVV
ncbi:hypothetical protein VIGAN_01537300 [Vigna angularis var. angularis]|uniref:Uncharacterized protein n=1 Tax=Vigna angularis var. angularis TaxID=157739 RepID=A0A0S3R9W1_PHAAN|nr:hypothetical protein VIGAN_01537300 [Vigna angularis var. angularis]